VRKPELFLARFEMNHGRPQPLAQVLVRLDFHRADVASLCNRYSNIFASDARGGSLNASGKADSLRNDGSGPTGGAVLLKSRISRPRFHIPMHVAAITAQIAALMANRKCFFTDSVHRVTDESFEVLPDVNSERGDYARRARRSRPTTDSGSQPHRSSISRSGFYRG
jgi:hypothetical protein